jgi:Zn-dependent oligopeptidase
MTTRPGALRALLALGAAVVLQAPAFAAPATLADFQAAATKSQLSLTLPDYARTPDELRARVDAVLKEADTALAALAAQDPAKLTFANTFGTYDAINARVSDVSMMSNTISESSLDQAMRDTGNELNVKIRSWGVGLDYREDIYRALKTIADQKPALDVESQRMMDEQMRSYRRAGLSLPAAQKAEVEQLRKDLSALTTQFGSEAARRQVPRVAQRHLARRGRRGKR